MRSPLALSLPRQALRWLDGRPTLGSLVAGLRRTLPGDARFGDSLSTAGPLPAQVAGRWSSRLRDGRLGVLGEVALAALQVAEWANRGTGPEIERPELTIVFADLAGYSSWAVAVGDDLALDLLRRVDARITGEVERRDGRVVKRLGDGVMAVFDEPGSAVSAGLAIARTVPALRVDGYRPDVRVGVHHGRPLGLGGDYLGVDVTVAARLCAAAAPGEVLLSGTVEPRVAHPARSSPRRQRGVPERLDVYSAARG
jgi:adenylate cyclase